MLKILLVEDEPALREVTVFLLESMSEAEVKVTEASSGNEAIKLMSGGAKFDAIVSDYNMPDGNGGEFFVWLQKNNHNIPFVLCSSDKASQHPELQGTNFYGAVEKPFFQDPLIKMITDLEKANPNKEVAATSAPKTVGAITEEVLHFAPVAISLLRRISPTPCAIYVKLSDSKYIKIAHKDHCFSTEDFSRFEQKGATHLYVLKENIQPFVDKVMRDVVSIGLTKAVNMTAADEINTELAAAMYDLGNSMGFSPNVQKLAKANVEITLKSLKQIPQLKVVFSAFNANSKNYIAMHSVMIANISCCLANQMGWNSEQTNYKLSLAAFLHDIALKKQEYAKFSTAEDITKNNVDEAGLKNIFEHPQNAAAIAAKFSEIPTDVDTIVIQHHELPDGTGFPKKLGHQRIAPLAAVFIVAEDLWRFYEAKGKAFHMNEFLESFASKYELGTFKQIAKAMSQMTLEVKAG